MGFARSSAARDTSSTPADPDGPRHALPLGRRCWRASRRRARPEARGAQRALADLPLGHFLAEAVIPYEEDEVTRLIADRHDAAAFAPVSHLTVGGFRDWLLGEADTAALAALAPGLTPEMAAGRQQDLPAAGPRLDRREVPRRHALPQHDRPAGHAVDPPAAERPGGRPEGRAAQILDGLLLGAGDAVIGVNPATDNVDNLCRLLAMLDALRERFAIPTQSCVLAHVTTTLMAIERGAPVDLVFQSIGGTEGTNRSFGVTLPCCGKRGRPRCR
jgi:ethanolamine ammonia-lyase large subunit